MKLVTPILTHVSVGHTPSPEPGKKELTGHQEGGGVGAKSAPSPSVKWPCLVCTYENWPRAALCVLCGARRGRTSPDHQAAASRDSPSPEGASMPRPPHGGSDAYIRNSPHTRRNQEAVAAAAASGGSSCSSGGPGASSAGLITAARPIGGGGGTQSGGCGGSPSGGDSTNNLQYEKRLRQLRRRMREADWAWVSACMGVVEGDACPVEAYLASGGDPTRKLTAAECSLLARPGVYEIGHTLVHLAVKLHRWVGPVNEE